jgi:hypothetical protein
VLRSLKDRHDLLQYIGDERAGDWRFLLPSPATGQALCVGGALSPVPLTLAQSCERVLVLDSAEDLRFLHLRASQEGVHNIELAGDALESPACDKFDLVAVLRAAPGMGKVRSQTPPWPELAARVAEGGHLYIEIDQPSLVLPPALARKRLRRLGFRRVACYWPKPTFAHCEMLLPLGDQRLQRYYLSEVFFAMTTRRRLLRPLLAVLIEAGLFELSLPGYMIVASGLRESERRGRL